MADAKSLRDLLLIRNVNREYLDSINGNLGTALGFKKKTGYSVSDEPAILVFVPKKIDPKWVPPGQEIKTHLVDDKHKLTCLTDVIEGLRDEPLVKVFDPDDPQLDIPPLPWSVLQGPAPLSAEQLKLRERLLGWAKKITPGAQIGGKDSKGKVFTGTLGFFAKDREKNEFGFVTNRHLALRDGNELYFPWDGFRKCGVVSRGVTDIPAKDRFNNLIEDPGSFFTVDCAFAALHRDISEGDIDVRLPLIQHRDITMKEIGEPFHLDLKTTGALGKKVLSVGPKRSLQRGTIYGFAYQFEEEKNKWQYTDHLIVGDDGQEFSLKGDSGKLIVTDDEELRPVALLWGGRKERLRSEREQEKWSYGVDINVVLDTLRVDIVRKLSIPTT